MTLLIWVVKLRSELNTTPKFLAVGLIISEKVPRLDSVTGVEFCMLNSIISDLELLSWRKFCAIKFEYQ